MRRREFFKNGLAIASGITIARSWASPSSAEILPAKEKAFNLNYAPHEGMFVHHSGKNFVDQIKFMHDQGFRAIEDNGMLQRNVAEQELIGKTLHQLGMNMGVFVIDGDDNWKTSLTTGNKDFADHFVKTCQRSVDTARRVNARWMTGVPGYFDRSLPLGIQTANVVEALRRGVEVFEPYGLIMVLEPLSDNPDLFLRTSSQSYEICRAVNSPSCKILYDIYHMQRNEGDLIKNIERVWNEIAYFQIGDNPGRKEPTSGEINYKNIFKYIYNRGYRGIMGMEHGNAGEGKEGEVALIKAYREADDFL